MADAGLPLCLDASSLSVIRDVASFSLGSASDLSDYLE